MADPRFTDLFTDGEADLVLLGVPYDDSVLGRKGARHGPAGIRAAFRFLGCHDPQGQSLTGLRIRDAGDVNLVHDGDVLGAHKRVQGAVDGLWGDAPAVILGGDHGLTYPHVASFLHHHAGRLGIIVIDAHYDLRDHEGQPTSGTPFRRILEETDGRVRGADLIEIGIRPYANGPSLAAYAAAAGVHVVDVATVRTRGMEAVIRDAMERLADVDHLWLSIDIDGLDQSIASGCSAPGAGGLSFADVEALVRAMGADPRCRAMDLLEVAPELDPTGNTCRTAAQLVAAFAGAIKARA